MNIGIDFDNTIVDYSDSIYELALQHRLIEKETSKSKISVKDHIQKFHGNDKWTWLQGQAYGKSILNAKPYKDSVKTLAKFISNNHNIFIISHKTKYPFIGEKTNLHEAARNWSNRYLRVEGRQIIHSQNLYFNETLDLKIQKICEMKLDVFVDDLPQILNHPKFPKGVRKILFNPNLNENFPPDVTHCYDWSSIQKEICKC